MVQDLFVGYPRLWWVVVAIISQVVGAFWYGPLFGKTFMKENDRTEADMKDPQMKPMRMMIFQEFISRLVFFLGLALLVRFVGVDQKREVGVFYFLAVLSSARTAVIRGKGKTWRSWAIDAGRVLVDTVIALLLYGLL